MSTYTPPEHVSLIADCLEVWRPFWAHDLKHLSDHDLAAEIEYVEREFKECATYDIVVDGHLDVQDYLAGQLVRQHMLREEVARRWKFNTLIKEQPQFVDFAHKLKAQLDLPTYIVSLGYCPDMKRVGGRYFVATCPLHTEHTPSFYVWEQPSPHFHCFGCGNGGDVFDFLLCREVDTWFDAVKRVAAYLNVALPRGGPLPLYQAYTS